MPYFLNILYVFRKWIKMGPILLNQGACKYLAGCAMKVDWVSFW